MIKLIGKTLYQWDTGCEVSVTPSDGVTVHEVHFANEGDTEALVVNVTTKNGVTTAPIPNVLLQTGRAIIAYAVSLTATGEETVESRTLPVRERQKPEDYSFEDDEVTAIRQLLSDVANATEKANTAASAAVVAAANANSVANSLMQAKENGEFNGPKGNAGVQGIPGKDGVDGYTPVRGTDYWTDADKAEIKSYVDEAILGGAW